MYLCLARNLTRLIMLALYLVMGHFQYYAIAYSNARLFSLLYSTLEAGPELLAMAYSNLTFFSDSSRAFHGVTDGK